MLASLFNLAGPDILVIALILLFGALTSVFWIYAIVHCAKNPALEGNEKIVWILIVIFLQFLGAIIYFLAAPRTKSG